MVSSQELNLALRLIEQWTVPFEPIPYVDTYREAVQTLIRTRSAGEKARPVHGFQAGDASRLLQTLEQSLSAAPRKRSTAEHVVARSARERKGN